MTGKQPNLTGVGINVAIHWGIWPGLVMVFAQWEAGRHLAIAVPTTISLITLAGTLAIYGCDRWLEIRCLSVTAARHQAPPWTLFLGSLVILGLFLFSLPGLNWHIIRWLSILALAGLFYLLITTGRLKGPPGFKEITGAFCFTLLIWGPLGYPGLLVSLAFFCIGLSNFFWASHQDMQRDKANELISLATLWPKQNRILARICALAGCLGFWYKEGLGTLFFWVAAIHLFWPERATRSIDWAFLPLLLTPALALW